MKKTTTVMAILLLTTGFACKRKNDLILGSTPASITFDPSFNGTWSGMISARRALRGGVEEPVLFPVTLTFSHAFVEKMNGRIVSIVRGRMEGTYSSPDATSVLVGGVKAENVGAGTFVADSKAACHTSYVFESTVGETDLNTGDIDPDVLLISKLQGNDCLGYITGGTGRLVRM